MFKKETCLKTGRRIAYMSYGNPETDVTLYRHSDGWSIHRGHSFIECFDTYREAKEAYFELTQR